MAQYGTSGSGSSSKNQKRRFPSVLKLQGLMDVDLTGWWMVYIGGLFLAFGPLLGRILSLYDDNVDYLVFLYGFAVFFIGLGFANLMLQGLKILNDIRTSLGNLPKIEEYSRYQAIHLKKSIESNPTTKDSNN